MKKAALLAGTCLSLAILISGPGSAQESTRYESWNDGTAGSTQDMVKALRDLVDEAEQARAADPRFLDDLKALANAFDDTAPLDLISDDFRDGDYTSGTEWTVTSGRWWVENAVGLRSVVAAPAASPVAATEPEPEPPRRSSDDLAEAILGDLLDNLSGRNKDSSGDSQQTAPPQQQPQTSGADAVPADVQVAIGVPNAFSLRMEITSRARYGELRVAAYQVSPQDGWGYQLAYTPGGQSGLRLMRVARGQHAVIAYHDGKIDLEDGRLHVIDWNRSVAGVMTVALDGTQLIEVTDTRLRDPFDGIAFSNRGGDYAVRDISVKRGR